MFQTKSLAPIFKLQQCRENPQIEQRQECGGVNYDL